MKVSAIQSTTRPNYINDTKSISKNNNSRICAWNKAGLNRNNESLSFKRSSLGAGVGGRCFGTLSAYFGLIAAAYHGIFSVSSFGFIVGIIAGGLGGIYLFDKIDKKLFGDETQKHK